MQNVLFPLDDTIVVFLHQDDTRTSTSHVVQITVKAHRKGAIDTITTYYLVRHELSELILRLVTAHLKQPVQEYIVFDDPRYTLHAHRDPWTFGKQLAFQWGEAKVEAAKEKWTFSFRVKRLEM